MEVNVFLLFENCEEGYVTFFLRLKQKGESCKVLPVQASPSLACRVLAYLPKVGFQRQGHRGAWGFLLNSPLTSLAPDPVSLLGPGVEAGLNCGTGEKEQQTLLK